MKNIIGDEISYKGFPTLQEFTEYAIKVMKTTLENDPSTSFYLTECTGCCSGEGHYKTSYRVFTDKIKDRLDLKRGGHVETGLDGFIAKIYSQPKGISPEISRVLSMATHRFPSEVYKTPSSEGWRIAKAETELERVMSGSE